MRTKAIICINLDEIDRVVANNERLSLPAPEPLPEPMYEEETAWIHIEDVSKALTKKLGKRRVIQVYMDDGSVITLSHTPELESKLDEIFLSTTTAE